MNPFSVKKGLPVVDESFIMSYISNTFENRETFRSLFRAKKIDTDGYDNTTLDVLMPHPDYSSQHFICVLSPSEATCDEQIRPMLADACDIAKNRYHKRNAN